MAEETNNGLPAIELVDMPNSFPGSLGMTPERDHIIQNAVADAMEAQKTLDGTDNTKLARAAIEASKVAQSPAELIRLGFALRRWIEE